MARNMSLKAILSSVPVLRLVALVAISLVLGVSCSGSDDGGRGKKPPATASESAWAIHFYVGAPASRKRMDVGPVPEVSFPASSAKYPALPKSPSELWKVGVTADGEKTEGAKPPPGSKPQAVVGDPDGGGKEFEQNLLLDSGWALVWGAAVQCQSPGRTGAPAVPPWKPKSGGAFTWSIFQTPPDSCDQEVIYSETLLCVASELARIAEATGPITWDKITTGPTGFPNGPWTIPPQKTADRFIARDLSIYMLATLALNDMWIPSNAPTGTQTTCSAAYAEAAATPGAADTQWLFGVGPTTPTAYFPAVDPVPSAANIPDLVDTRLRFNAQILRSAGRLLKELIEDAVAADLAGTEQRRARATDPVRGSEIAWGQRADEDSGYNSLAHAVRILTGRWELSPNSAAGAYFGRFHTTDPKCGSVARTELLAKAYGEDLTARVGDESATTAGQKTALDIVNSAGIVIPSTEFAAPGGMANARNAISAQLVQAAAKANGINPTDPEYNLFKTAGQGASIGYVLKDVADADLEFALSRTFGHYRLLASKPANVPTVVDPGAGLKTAATQAPELAQAKGVALQNGIPRQDAAVDFMARAGGLLEASQCDEYNGILGQLFAADFAYTSTFQDSFAIGQAIGRRLVLLRESAAVVPALSGAESVANHAGEAVGEVRAWTGPGRFATTSIPDGAGGVSEIWVLTFGLDPSDLAVPKKAQRQDELDAMQSEIVLAYGPPWVGDCAAGLRTNCPDGFEQKYVVSKTSALVSDNPAPGWKAITGSDGTFGWFIFPGSNADQFKPTYFGSGAPNSHDRLYIVARHDPLSPSAKGRVLGSASLRVPYGGTGMPVSNLQRKLLNDVLGVSAKWRDQFGQIGVGSTSISPAYCIKGVPKDLFVPLENELTSDSDQYENSWKHYLSLAQQAAQRADELGEKLIEIGLQKDLRREAAGEELANICGDFSALDKVNVEGGEVKAPSTDKALQDCLKEDKYDIVFLTNDPTEGLEPAAQTQFIKTQIIGCPGSSSPLCGQETITHAGLNLATYQAPQTAAPVQCDSPTVLAGSLKANFQGAKFKSIGTEEWASAARLKFLANRLQVYLSPKDPAVVGMDGHWELRLSGVAMMSSAKQNELWPGCRWSGQICAGASAALFDTLFRRAAAGSVLGTGPDALGSDPDRELNVILWRVQGAAWLIGALSGSIPQAMFKTQIPAANFAAPDWGTQTKQAPVFSIFATGNFVKATGVDEWFLEAPVSEKDRLALGRGTQIPTTFWWPATGEIPNWLVGLYAAPTARFVHVEAANPELGGFGTKNVADFVSQQLDRLSGISCDENGSTKFQGSPLGPAAKNHQDAAAAITSVRAGKKWGQTCQNAAGTNVQGMKVNADGSLASVFRDAVTAFPFFCNPEDTTKKQVPLFPLSSLDGELTDCAAISEASAGDGALPDCDHPRPGGIHAVSAACAGGDQHLTGFEYRYTNRMLLPRSCSAGSRVQLYVNSYPAPGVCGAASQLAQALAMACQFNVAGLSGGVVESQPELTKLEHLDGFVLWIDYLERKAKEQVGKLYVEKVPKKVVDDYAATKVGTGAQKGLHGTQLLELRKALESLAGSWNRVTGDVGQLRDAVDGARISIVGAGIDQKSASAQLALQRMQIHANMVASVSGLVGPNLASVASGTVNATAQIGFGTVMLQQTDVIEKLSKEKYGNEVAAALNQLQLVSNPLYTDLQNAIGDIRSATATVLSISNQNAQTEAQAQYEAAKGSGAPFVVIDGQAVEFPVNIVQNRLYDVTRLRYLAALEDAKYLAYVARLAIEQRIGVRLSTISTPVGPLEAPAIWADDVCSLTGIDYQKLRSLDAGADGGVLGEHEKEIVAEFADQYVGDYVTKLANFVEYYNIAYPSHDGDDTAILSLRDDLLGPTAGCVKEAPNLLYYSSDLTVSDVLSENGQTLVRGWELNACEKADVKCLRADPGTSMKDPPSALPDEAPVGSVTWLHDEANPIQGTDAGAPLPVPVLPARTVSQRVDLVAGSTYLLSWWDQARAGDGALLAAPSVGVEYRVEVLAPDGSQVLGQTIKPFVPGSAAPLWSERRSVDFKASQSGGYRILFAASFEGATQGSVAIANAQLEQGPPGALPGAYVDTDSSRQYLAPDCVGKTADDVQKAFRHVCDANKQCYYELVAPIVIDTKGLASGKSCLNGKLAAGNFNFRHITLALNVVGTGVYDCTANPSQSCFGSAFVEYTVDHDAFQAGVIGWNSDVQTFNFGSAGINHAKALAAEKYITLPIGSADQNLLAQPGIEKPEYRGRPLDGSYRVRIWDSPYLVWNRLEDIQLVLKYRYWSKIQPQPAP